MTGAQAAVAALAREGVGHVFSLPGTTLLPLYDALREQSEVRLVVARHEQGAAHMAEGYARAGRRPGVCMASRGPGAANLALGMHNAYAASSPVMAIVGSVSTDIAGRDAFEEMDLLTFYRPVTKWAVEVGRADRVPEFVQRGLRLSMLGRPRPVLVALPQDVQQEKAPARFLPEATPVRGPVPDPGDIDRALALLAGARRPLILAGGGVTWAGAAERLAELATATGIPVIATHSRKENFPNDHPLFRGSITGSSGAAPSTVSMASEADVVLALGCRFSEFTTRRYKLFRQSTLIHVDIDPSEMGKVYTPALGIVADLGATIDALAKAVKARGGPGPGGWDWSPEIEENYRQESTFSGPFPESPIHPAHLVAALQDVLDRDALLVSDSGSFRTWFDRYYRFRSGGFMAPGGGSMGFGFPAALGAKVAQPDRQVVCLAGDGGALMVFQELATAVQYDLRVVLVVINNDSYGNVKNHQRKSYGGRYFGVDLVNPDFAALARSFGASGERVTEASGLRPALLRALNHRGPAVVEVAVDREKIQP